MSRWVPHPYLAAILFVIWLLLTQSFSLGQVLLGSLVAIAGTHALAALQPERFKGGSMHAALKLAGIVAVDIVRSNFAVAAIILIPRKQRVSNFVRLPLDLTDRNGLAVLALIITATPGTMWVEFDGRRNMLLVHVLDLVDEAEWVRLIKGRYEALLLDIFGR